ncbi:hypothetical protein LMG24235_08112 [Paraburkholderia sabiae]|nr:hypothetical protein LMG24235_08112 [Paraburkholderia sabiae]
MPSDQSDFPVMMWHVMAYWFKAPLQHQRGDRGPRSYQLRRHAHPPLATLSFAFYQRPDVCVDGYLSLIETACR